MGTPRSLKVGIVCHPTYGGSGVVASELGLGLAERGHEIHVFSHRRPIRIPPQAAHLHFHEVEVTTYPLFTYPPYTLALATRLYGVSKEHRLDILHAHYAVPHSLSTYLCRQMLAAAGERLPKLVTTLHGTDITLVGLDPSFYEITRFGLLESDLLTAVSTHLANQTRHDFGIDRAVEVVPNFVDATRFHPSRRDEALRATLLGDEEFLIGHLSNFRAVKRVNDVVRVFHGIQEQVSARLVLIGDGPERESVANLAGELGIQEKVQFLGFYRDVPELLAQLDLFILPSDYESFGLAALEAMACGVPVVAANAGGLPEVIEDGVSGALSPPRDVASMVARSLALLQNGARRAAMSRAARIRAEEVFPRHRALDRYEQLYHGVLDGGAADT
jgi:N-acetyl-alpha-D-glucosaminyl L-malate synthase BshA